MSKIIIYATDKDGDGHVMQIGKYESVYEIRIPVGHFAPDVVLTFEEDVDEMNEEHRISKGWDKTEEKS